MNIQLMSSKSECPRPNPDSVNSLFPSDSQPEDRMISLACQNPKRLYEIRNDPIESLAYIRKLLAQFINDPDCLFRPTLKQYLTDHANDKELAIKVNGVGFYDSAASGEKPCIYLKYAGSKLQQDFAFDNSVDYNDENASETFYGRQVMAFSVYALSEQYTESLALIEEVRRFLHYLQLPIKRSLCWQKLEIIEMQPPAKDENFDCFTATLSCVATFNELWSVREAAPLLKKIDFNV